MKKAMLMVLALVMFLTTFSFAQPAGLTELKWALKKFEQSVRYSYQSRSWKRRRSGWISRVNMANTPKRMGRAIIELETSMKWSSMKPSWRSRRSPWIAETRAARTITVFANLLLELERKTYYKAQYTSWKSKRTRWVRRLKALVD
jgi:hypothetical protein